ncbi:GDP-mannose 4,6-dehydratase [soil metagenome]
MKVAIISGVTGQDGSLLAALLLGKGYRVIGLVSPGRVSDSFRLEYLRITDKVEMRQINLLDNVQVKQLLEDTSPDEFYNLAAISSVSHSFRIPFETFSFNTGSVMNILESIRIVSPGTRFYQASSSEMFGNIGSHRLPIKESFLFHPVSPYGTSKASAHWLAINYREAYKLKACCGILFNHESALRPPHFVIKKIVRTAIQISNGYDGKLSLGNTSIVRDWGYAPLYVDAMWRMLQQEEMNDYLICSGSFTKLDDFVQKVFARVDLDAGDHVSIDSSLLRSLDLEIIYGDNAMAKKALGWEYNLSTDNFIQRLIDDEIELMKWESALKK